MNSKLQVTGLPALVIAAAMVVASALLNPLLPPARAAETATLEGDVDFSGVRSMARTRAHTRYPSRSSAQATEPPPPLAVIYIEGSFDENALASARARPEKGAPVLHQTGLRFVPHLLPVVVGGSVRFPNNDDTYHNVFSYSITRKFDLGRYLRGEEPPFVVFDQSGIAKIFCEIHHHMRATILVLETPFFTLTDEDGAFRIPGVPPGSYRVTAWIDEQNVWTRTVVLQPGRTTSLKFTGS